MGWIVVALYITTSYDNHCVWRAEDRPSYRWGQEETLVCTSGCSDPNVSISECSDPLYLRVLWPSLSQGALTLSVSGCSHPNVSISGYSDPLYLRVLWPSLSHCAPTLMSLYQGAQTPMSLSQDASFTYIHSYLSLWPCSYLSISMFNVLFSFPFYKALV